MNRKSGRDANWDETAGRPWIGKMERWGRKILYRLASFFVCSSSSVSFSFQKVRKILIVKEPYRMGDLIQITPTLRALRNYSPELYIGLVIQDRNLPVFENNPDLNEIFLYEKSKFNRAPWALLKFIRRIRARRVDLAVTLETQRTHLTNDLIAYFSGAPWRLRYAGNAFDSPESDIFYNLLSPLDASALHEVEKNFGVFKPFGATLNDRSLALKVSEKDLGSARKILLSQLPTPNPQLSTDFIVIHPGAYKINNRWPLERYLEVGKRVRAQGGEVVFILGPSEGDWEGGIKRQNFPVISKISILEMAGIFKFSQKVLCNDTGVMHIAAAVGAKVVALFGATDPARWKPPGEFVKVIQSTDKKIASIEIEKVLQIVLS